MTSDKHMIYRCEELSICPQGGEIAHLRGSTARLSPVNMKVLALLLGRAGEVVSREEIFDAIWKNQVVSDDALTRNISDIRAQLNRLVPNREFIETLPRRGYRWTAPISQEDRRSFQRREMDTDQLAQTQPYWRWLRISAAYLLSFLLLASVSLWLLDKINTEATPIIAILPIQAPPTLQNEAVSIEQALNQQFVAEQTVAVLTPSAIDARPLNPFPYFYTEFNARWVLECQIRETALSTTLTLTLADARNGIVLFQTSSALDEEGIQQAQEEILNYINQ